MSAEILACTECGWLGTRDDLKEVPHQFEDPELEGIAYTDHICPICGCDEFYHVNSTFGIDKEVA
jgi:hypothetical protein